MKIDVHGLGRILGIIIVFIALYFVAEKIWSNNLWVFTRQFTKQIVVVIVFGSIAYAVSSFLLSAAWLRLLVWFGQFNGTVKDTHAVYARTQIAKYIPGNIFHFAGRHVLGTQMGYGHGQLTGAAIYEIAGFLIASSSLVLVGIVFYGMKHIQISVVSLLTILFSMLLVSLFSTKVIERLPKFKRLRFKKKKISEVVTVLIPTYCLYVIFLIIAGIIFCWVTNTISHIENIHQAGYVIMTLAVSWIAGFITPGASGGIGVREAIMVIMLKNTHGESASLFIALIFRTITVMGDFVFFLSSFVMKINLSGGKENKIRL